MNRVRSPLFGVARILALALLPAFGCAHAPEPSPAAEERPAAHPAPPPAKEPAPAPAAAAPRPAPGKPAERSAPPPRAEHPATAGNASTAGKPAQAAKPAPPPAKEPAPPPAPPVATRADPGTAGEYFPLAVGNEWVYVDQSPALPQNRRGVLRTVRILERTADGFYRDNERGNLRVDGNCIRDRDRRLLCLPFTVGASWSSVLSATTIERYEIASAGEAVETPAGTRKKRLRGK